MEPTDEDKKQLTADSSDPLNKILFSMKKIERELGRFNSHRLIAAYNSIPRLLFYQFLKGISFGLGSVLGATIVVSILVYLLSQIEFIPIVGEWVKHIAQEIKK